MGTMFAAIKAPTRSNMHDQRANVADGTLRTYPIRRQATGCSCRRPSPGRWPIRGTLNQQRIDEGRTNGTVRFRRAPPRFEAARPLQPMLTLVFPGVHDLTSSGISNLVCPL